MRAWLGCVVLVGCTAEMRQNMRSGSDNVTAESTESITGCPAGQISITAGTLLMGQWTARGCGHVWHCRSADAVTNCQITMTYSQEPPRDEFAEGRARRDEVKREADTEAPAPKRNTREDEAHKAQLRDRCLAQGLTAEQCNDLVQ